MNFARLYKEGFLPGPEETEQAFFDRVEKTRAVLKEPKKFITDRSFDKIELVTQGGAALLAKKRNLFFHAASTLIVELKDGLILPIITEPKSILVKKEEVLAHELVHARRALFDSPKYEEILAFRTSKAKWRKYLSPIFSTNIEVLLFFVAATLSFWTTIPLFLHLGFFSIRLYYRQKIIRHCKDFLNRISTDTESILTALTDEEIVAFSRGEIEKIDFSLFRWKFLQRVFPLKL
ncbi:hypothetical protein K0U07_02740 [bacterium]|nr:hypothetical protein [bacterium]